MDRTPEVTARFGNRASWLERTLGGRGGHRGLGGKRGQGWALPLSPAADWTPARAKQGAPEESWAADGPQGFRGCGCCAAWS